GREVGLVWVGCWEVGGGDCGPSRRLALGAGGLELVSRIVRAFPGEPVRRPSRVRGLDAIRAEWESCACRTIQKSTFIGQKLPDGFRERLPGEQGTWVVIGGGDRRCEERHHAQSPLTDGVFVPRRDLAADSASPPDHGRA